jgi:hypothetical protein
MVDHAVQTTATLEIRRNSDGAIRRDPNPWDWHGDFIWEEGNFSCDCNRYLFWCRAADEPEAEDEDGPEHACGDDRYSVRLTDQAGNVLYEDFSAVGQSPTAPQEGMMRLEFIIAQLRHAYAQLNAGTVRDQKEFAKGLLAPQIESLEQLAITWDREASTQKESTG